MVDREWIVSADSIGRAPDKLGLRARNYVTKLFDMEPTRAVVDAPVMRRARLEERASRPGTRAH